MKSKKTTEVPLEDSAAQIPSGAPCYLEMSTDDLLEKLPSNLHLARNENAPKHDRWRIYNSATKKYCEPGKKTARDLLVYLHTRLANELKEWTGR